MDTGIPGAPKTAANKVRSETYHQIGNLNPLTLSSWESKGTPPMPPPQEIRPY